jgi:hypothetical protein
MNYLSEYIGANVNECNAWIMTQVDYVKIAKRIEHARFSNDVTKLVLFEYGYDPKNNHLYTDFIPGTDVLVNNHVRSLTFVQFSSSFLSGYNPKIHVYVRGKVDYALKKLHPFLKQVVMEIDPGAFDDPEMPSLIPVDQTLE